MADVTAILLREGRRLLSGALAGMTGVGPTHFRVGPTAGFTPQDTDTDVRGGLAFEGKSGLIQIRMVAVDTVRYTMIITEAFGPFDIGNIVMYASNGDDNALPMFEVVLPFAVKKTRGDPDLNNATPFPSPGNRFTINVTIKHSLDGDDINIEVINPEFASLPVFDTQLNIPPAAINPWQQFVVHNDTRVNSPVVVSKDEAGQYWGIPFWQNLRSPKFGVIDGGVSGDNHLEEQGAFLWGYFYLTPNILLTGTLGSTGYIQDNDSYVGNIGGASY